MLTYTQLPTLPHSPFLPPFPLSPSLAPSPLLSLFFHLEEEGFTGQGHAETNLDKPT